MPKKIKVNIGDMINGLEVLEELPSELQGKCKKRTFLFKCECGDSFKCTLNRVKTGNTTGCGCRRKFPTPRHREVSLINKFNSTQLKVVDGQIIDNGLFKVNIKCLECNNSFFRDFNTLISKSVECPDCALINKSIGTEESLLKQLSISLKETTLSFDSKCATKPLKTSHDIILKCSECNNKLKRRFEVANTRKLQCSCRTSNGFDQTSPATLYVLTIKDGEIIIGYKYGITKNLKERVSAIKRKCDYDVSLFMSWDYELGSQALIHEYTFKQLYKSYISNKSMKSGNTETFPPESLEDFLSIQSSQYYKLIGEQSWIYY